MVSLYPNQASGNFMTSMPTGQLAAASVPLAQSVPVSSSYGSSWKPAPMLTASFTSPQGYPLFMYTLRNGHRVIIEQRPTDVISLRTFINTGSIVENPVYKSTLYGASSFPSGIAHLDEHCHFLTTQNFQRKNSWPETVERLGANYNASTDNEVIQHELAFNKEDLPSMLALHSESVLRPLYKKEDITQEKTNVINEMSKRMAPPENQVFSKTCELLFDRPGFQSLGRKIDVQQTTVEQLQQFHQTFYTPTNMVTVISGRLNPAQVLQMLDREFGNNPPRIQPNYQPSIQLALKPGEIRHATIHDPKLTYSMVNLAFPAPARANLKERIAMEFLGRILGDGSLSLLETEVKNNRRLATSIELSYEPLKTTGSFGIYLETTPGQEQDALKATLQTISKLSYEGISQQKITEIQQKMIQDYRNSLSDIETSTMTMGNEALYNSLPYYFYYEQLVNNITPMDLIQAAQKYLNPSSYAVVFGVPETKQKPPPRGGAT